MRNSDADMLRVWSSQAAVASNRDCGKPGYHGNTPASLSRRGDDVWDALSLAVDLVGHQCYTATAMRLVLNIDYINLKSLWNAYTYIFQGQPCERINRPTVVYNDGEKNEKVYSRMFICYQRPWLAEDFRKAQVNSMIHTGYTPQEMLRDRVHKESLCGLHLGGTCQDSLQSAERHWHGLPSCLCVTMATCSVYSEPVTL